MATAATPSVKAKSGGEPPKAPAKAKPLPAPNGDFYDVIECLRPDERREFMKVRELMEREVAPIITKYWAAAEFPFEVLPKLRELDIVGLGCLRTTFAFPACPSSGPSAKISFTASGSLTMTMPPSTTASRSVKMSP
jgi:hypothetical protein